MMQNSQQFTAHLDALHDEHVSRLLGNIHENSPVLYHYTSLKSAVEILQNNTLRFTNVLYLNDPSELRSGIQIGEKVMSRLIDHYKAQNNQLFVDLLGILLARIVISFAPHSIRQERAKTLKAKLTSYVTPKTLELFQGFLNADEWSLYIACLSAKGDDLRQWLPYADNGGGVAIGFRPMVDSTHYLTKHPRNKVFVISVCYAEDRQKEEYLTQFLTAALKAYSLTTPLTVESMNSFVQKMTDILVTDLVACKSPHYKDEEEWRLFFVQSAIDHLIMGDEPSPSFYVKNNIIKPYHDIELEKDAVVEIKLGARCQDELNTDALTMLCHCKGMFNIPITKSKIDYRG